MSVTAQQMALRSGLNTEVHRSQIVWETTTISQMFINPLQCSVYSLLLLL